MFRGAIALFQTMTAGLLMLAALVVFGTPSAAHAHGTPHAIAAEPAATPSAVLATLEAPAGPSVTAPASDIVVVSTAPAPPSSDDDGCGRHGGPGTAFGCCFGAACAAMHGGLAPAGPVPLPGPAVSATLMPVNQVSEGISTPPAIRPPRAAV